MAFLLCSGDEVIDDDTKESLDKYWEATWSNFTFFKKTEVDFTIFLMPTWNIYASFKDKCFAAHNNSLPWLSRYWANAYLEMHLSFMWNEDVERAILIEDLDIKKAWAQADKKKLERTKTLKELYP